MKSTNSTIPEQVLLVMTPAGGEGEEEGGEGDKSINPAPAPEIVCKENEKINITPFIRSPTLGRIYENLQRQDTIPPHTNETKYKEKEETRIREMKERQERYAAREKFRQDTETYGDIFVDWDKIMKEKELKLRQEEKERKMRIKKSQQLGGTWELLRVCKSFLEEWENDWTESEQKSRMRQEEREQVLEKAERFKKIEKKKNEIRKKSVQTRIDFCVNKLGRKGQEELKAETRREKIELQELRMNLWRWREDKIWQGKTERTK